ncbi:MAG: hypothetical protein KY437_04975 [Actinobacteria bacterium]|nr:hypothetical protein [Actinomycetota bacterium]
MQLSDPTGPVSDVDDLATALRVAAERFGHRPALTVVRADRRDEQGFASLARWAAKGAHLLQLDALLDPGDRLRLHASADWPAATVLLAAWWAGVEVTLDGDADVMVVHESLHAPDSASQVFVLGDEPDGSSTSSRYEPWAIAVQAFPDQPPEPAASPDRVAAEAAGGSWTHRQLIDEAGRWGADGRLGLQHDEPAATWLPAILRPLLTGQATVILAGGEHNDADDEGVATWA